MGSVMIGNFGIRNGVQVYTITGLKDDLYKIIEECREMEAKFEDTPTINHVHRGQWVLHLKLKIPVGVGSGDQTD
jgi:hypothetical protein